MESAVVISLSSAENDGKILKFFSIFSPFSDMESGVTHLRHWGRFSLDTEKKVFWCAGEPVKLQPKEIELLCVLAKNEGEVVTKDELLRGVWADTFVEESNLTRHIYQIRKSFREYGVAGEAIKTVSRRGYRFVGGILAADREMTAETPAVVVVSDADSAERFAPDVARATKSAFGWIILPAVALVALLTTTFGFYLQLRRNGEAGLKSVAVLPLRSLDDGDGTALGHGFADTLVTSLGKLDGIRVISAQATSRYADKEMDPAAIGRELDVDAVVEGTLQKSEDKIRITLRLLRVADQKQIWARSFDEPAARVFDLQDRIAEETADALALTINERSQPKPPTADLEAYRLYLQGQYFFRRRETSKSGPFFRKAVERDPRFAQAWAGLAAVYAMGDSMSEAETTVNVALSIAPELAEAHAVHGFVKMFLDWDWNSAEKSLVRAMELDRNCVEALHWHGTLMTIRRRFPEAEVSLGRALSLDPTSANLTADLGLVYYYSAQYPKAEETFLRAGVLDPKFADQRLRALYETQGREREAFDLFAVTRCPAEAVARKTKCLEQITKIFEKEGLQGINKAELKETRALIAGGKTSDAVLASRQYQAASLAAALGNKPEAIGHLKLAVETKQRFEIMNFTLPFMAAETRFASLHDEPGFQDLVHRLKLD